MSGWEGIYRGLLAECRFILPELIIRCTIFSDLRKQARKLENEIDVKLVAFSKMGTNSIPAFRHDK